LGTIGLGFFFVGLVIMLSVIFMVAWFLSPLLLFGSVIYGFSLLLGGLV
jgi:uncharacterized protein HemY